jgi:hypothetical protein
MNESYWFPSSYDDARLQFRKSKDKLAQQHTSIQAGSFAVPSRVDTDLTVDWFYIPSLGSREKILILTSGVHGPETYTGSAIQKAFCDDHLESFLEKGVSVLLVHSINPFGFKFNRRATENNVNLNRNFDVNPNLFKNSNEGYKILQPTFEPSGPVNSIRYSSVKRSLYLLSLLGRGKLKRPAMMQAFGQGQYESSKGLEFGGFDFEPQVIFLKDLFSKITEAYSEVLYIDLHTGLGKEKALQIITGETPLSPSAHERLDFILGDTFKSGLFDYIKADTRGFYRTHGDIVSLLPKMWEGTQKLLLCLTAEFGTVGASLIDNLYSLNALILENQGFHFGYENENLRSDLQNMMMKIFFPASLSWRRNAIDTSKALFSTILKKY